MRIKPSYCYIPYHYRANTLNIDTISNKDVKENLFNKEMIDKELIVGDGDDNNNAQEVSLFVRGRYKEKGSNGNKEKFRSKFRNKNLTCNYCKKKGHIKTECYKLLNR